MTFVVFIIMKQKYVKLSEYAKSIGVCYKTAYRYWQSGQITGKQLPTGTILIDIDQNF